MDDQQFRTGKGIIHNPHGINDAYKDVRQFHVTFDHPRAEVPTMQTPDRMEARATWIESEVQELRDAKDVVQQADAYLDIAYFAIGGLVELGVPPGELWKLVQAANMAKVWPDGSVRKREDGKVLKPDGWEAPDEKIRALIEKMQNPS